MVNQHYRWDFIGLSTDDKPTPETSEKVVDGSTFYESDTSKLYVFCDTEWYEKQATGGGGGTTYTAGDGIDITNDTISVDPVQTPGTSTTDVMSQNATTSMIYSPIMTSIYSNWGAVYIGNKDANNQITADPSSSDTHATYFYALPNSNNAPLNRGLCILGIIQGGIGCVSLGQGSYTSGNGAIAIGQAAHGEGIQSIAIGDSSHTNGKNYSIALGCFSHTNRSGEVNIGTGNSSMGYNSSKYRILGGVYDGEDAHDAVTVGQVNAVIDAINTALSTNIPHIGVTA